MQGEETAPVTVDKLNASPSLVLDLTDKSDYTVEPRYSPLRQRELSDLISSLRSLRTSAYSALNGFVERRGTQRTQRFTHYSRNWHRI